MTVYTQLLPRPHCKDPTRDLHLLHLQTVRHPTNRLRHRRYNAHHRNRQTRHRPSIPLTPNNKLQSHLLHNTPTPPCTTPDRTKRTHRQVHPTSSIHDLLRPDDRVIKISMGHTRPIQAPTSICVPRVLCQVVGLAHHLLLRLLLLQVTSLLEYRRMGITSIRVTCLPSLTGRRLWCRAFWG
jgi:hypothetical protein